ncbi:MAG: DUF4382 domain-containing protein [Gemmatimonadota bacterium]
MNRTLLGAALLAALIPLGACSDVTGEQSASVNVLLTDAPGDVEAAWVTVTEVSLVAQGGEDDEEGGSIILLSSEPWTGDLLELQNDVEVLVQGAEVPTGRYTQLRLVITEGCVAVETESEDPDIYTSSASFDACGSTAGAGTLHMPSFGQSGLKINLPSADTDFEGEQTLLLDFDVSESFGHQAGASGMWVMTPVIKATSFGAAATVNVDVTLGTGIGALLTAAGFAITDFSVKLDGEAPVALAADGSATLEFVTSGSHTLSLVGPDGWALTTSPTSPHTFTTTAGATQTVALTLTGFTES